MRIFITGASGFVGGHLISFLKDRNFDLSLLVRRKSDQDAEEKWRGCEIYHYDSNFISVLNAIKSARPNVIVHLASYYVYDNNFTDIDLLLDSNIRLGAYILEAMKETGVTNFINTGTSFEHYQDEYYNPVNLYAATKFAFQDILKFYSKAGFINAITLKLFDTYGPNDTRGKILSLLKDNLNTGRTIELSEGEQIIDIIHIYDLCEAYFRAINLLTENSFRSKVYGISSEERMSLRELVSMIERLSKKKLNIIWGAKPYRNREVMNPWSNFEKLPGWAPSISLEKGLTQVINGDR